VSIDEEYIDIAQAARELNLGQSTIWLLLKRSEIQRFRIPGEGKKTFIRRGDLPKLRRPVPIENQGKAAGRVSALAA
jgi:hypothetical protein